MKRVMKYEDLDITDAVKEAVSPAVWKAILGKRHDDLHSIVAEFVWSEYEDETPQRGEQSGGEGQ